MTALDTRLAELQATGILETTHPENWDAYTYSWMGTKDGKKFRAELASVIKGQRALIKALKLAIEQRDQAIRDMTSYDGVFCTDIEDAAILAVLNAKGEA